MNAELFFDNNFFEIIQTIAAVSVYLALRVVVSQIIRKQAEKHDLNASRKVYTQKFFNISLVLLLLVVLGFIWHFSFAGLFASFFAIAGVALFANWSILSNITASVILFFTYPFKLGGKIRIMDGDNSVEGIVKDISFFAILIEIESGELVSYPNNLALQKGIIQKN